MNSVDGNTAILEAVKKISKLKDNRGLFPTCSTNEVEIKEHFRDTKVRLRMCNI